jgi:hypothetical protein
MLKAAKMKRTDLPMRHIVIIRAFMQAANDPQASMLKEIADRVDGKVPDEVKGNISHSVTGFEEILKRAYDHKDEPPA